MPVTRFYRVKFPTDSLSIVVDPSEDSYVQRRQATETIIKELSSFIRENISLYETETDSDGNIVRAPELVVQG